MSNSLAVAAVTATIKNLLYAAASQDLAGTSVTTRPPDRARFNITGNQLNVFLYQTAIEAGWRNEDMPGIKSGEVGRPPMPLILHYLITAYSDTDDDLNSHRLLGRAVSVLNDHPRLEREDLRTAIPGADVHRQVERVHVTPQPLTVEELSKLWSTFQTPLRISAAYQACIVLIESTLPARAALPVLTRGKDDRGPTAVAASRPEIERIEFPGGTLAAAPEGTLVLRGHDLAGEPARVFLQHLRLPTTVELTPASVTATAVVVDLATSNVSLPAGQFLLTVALGEGARTITSDPIPFHLAPKVTSGLPAQVPRTNGIAQIDLTIAPPLVAGQDATLLIGGQAVVGQRTDATSVTFRVADLDVRDYYVRVRVDGADSALIDVSGPTPEYDATQKVTVTQ